MKVGDKVVCINDKAEHKLNIIKGREYIIESINAIFVDVMDLNGHHIDGSFYKRRFKISLYREEKLKRILK